MLKRIIVLCIGVSLALVCGGLLSAQGASREAPSWNDYKVLIENNMFLRNRTRARPREQAVRPVTPVRAPERDFVLTGIVQRDSGCIAFVEDMRTSETLKLRSGDSVANGEIVEISLDGLVYLKGDQSLDVKMGGSLGGAYSPPASSATGEGAGGSVDVSAPPISLGESAILERMRQRREKELQSQ